MLDLCPPIWCIHNSVSEYEREIRDRNLNSIWLLFDPITEDKTRMIVGIDVNRSKNTLLYMDTTNNRFTNNVPIRDTEFFSLVSSKLGSDEMEKGESDRGYFDGYDRDAREVGVNGNYYSRREEINRDIWGRFNI